MFEKMNDPQILVGLLNIKGEPIWVSLPVTEKELIQSVEDAYEQEGLELSDLSVLDYDAGKRLYEYDSLHTLLYILKEEEWDSYETICDLLFKLSYYSDTKLKIIEVVVDDRYCSDGLENISEVIENYDSISIINSSEAKEDIFRNLCDNNNVQYGSEFYKILENHFDKEAFTYEYLVNCLYIDEGMYVLYDF